MRKLAIVVGHNSVQQGAVRGDTKETEFAYNSKLAKLIQGASEAYEMQVKIFHRIPMGSFSREIDRVYEEVDQWDADASIELHFNGAKSATATGTETLSSGTPLSLRLATAVQREMVIALGLRDRGIKTRAADARGGRNLHSGKAPAILVEPFFGTSAKGQAATDSLHEKQDLADAIVRGAAEAIGAFPRKTLDDSRTMAATARQTTATTVGVTSLLAAIAAPAVQNSLGVDLGAPWLEELLSLVSAASLFYQRHLAGKIEAFRKDDHDRQIR